MEKEFQFPIYKKKLDETQFFKLINKNECISLRKDDIVIGIGLSPTLSEKHFYNIYENFVDCTEKEFDKLFIEIMEMYKKYI